MMNKSMIPKTYFILLSAIALTGCVNAANQLLAFTMNGMLVISFIVLLTSVVAKNEVGTSSSFIVICITYALAYFADSLNIDFPFIAALAIN